MAPGMTPYLKWLLRARPADYALAVSLAGASLPVVGRHLEPLAGLTAMGMWGARHAPEVISAATRDMFAPGGGDARRRDRESTQQVSLAALRGLVSAAELESQWPVAQRTPPIWDGVRRHRHLYRRAVHYGHHPAQVLDVWRRKDLPAQPAPVLIFVPGGAWVHGKSMGQGSALMSRLAEQGWVCLAIDYRVAPHHRWPRHIVDVKTAIAWARANVDKFGGDRNFVAIAGCSAGGHLSALAGLTPDDPQYRGMLPEGADTSVDAVVGIYGRYDWRTARRRSGSGSSIFWSGWWSGSRSPVIPRCSATPRRSPGAPKCAAVLGDSRQQGQRHPGRAGPQLRRAAQGGVAFDGGLPGVARGGPRIRPHRRRAGRCGGTRVLAVPRSGSSQQDADRGKRGHLSCLR